MDNLRQAELREAARIVIQQCNAFALAIIDEHPRPSLIMDSHHLEEAITRFKVSLRYDDPTEQKMRRWCEAVVNYLDDEEAWELKGFRDSMAHYLPVIQGFAQHVKDFCDL